MMTHRGLTQVEHGRQLPGNLLTGRGTEQIRNDPDPHRIGKGLHTQRDVQGIGISHWSSSHRGTTHRRGCIDYRQRFGHRTMLPHLLTYIEKVGMLGHITSSIYVSQVGGSPPWHGFNWPSTSRISIRQSPSIPSCFRPNRQNASPATPTSRSPIRR